MKTAAQVYQFKKGSMETYYFLLKSRKYKERAYFE